MPLPFNNDGHSRENVSVTARGQEFIRHYNKVIHALENPSSVPPEVRSELADMDARLRSMMASRGHGSPDLILKDLTVGAVSSTPILQELAVKFANDEFIGDRVLPSVPVTRTSGAVEYWYHNPENALTDVDDTIGEDGSVNEVTEKLTRGSATMNERANKESVDVNALTQQDSVVRVLVEPLMTVMNNLGQRRERRQATLACTSSNYGSNTATLTGSDKWDSDSGGDPQGAVEDAANTILSGTGQQRTVGFCGPTTFKVLRTHPAARDAFKYTKVGRLTREEVRDWLGLDELLVGRARYNTSLRGATASYSRVWTDTVFGVVRAPVMPMVKQVTFGVTLQAPYQEFEYMLDDPGAAGKMVTKVSTADAVKVVAAVCGYLYTGVRGS
jgi:hypothetical protein